MPKINVYLPDELADAVRDAGVPVSAICQRALEQAVRRITAIRETTLGNLDLDELTTRLPHFTGRARAVVKLAIDAARAEPSPTVGTRHLLHALLAEGNNLALRILPTMEIEPDQVDHALSREPNATSQAPEQQAPTTTGDTALHFSGSAVNAMELAVTEATALGHNYVGCEHLLLGMIIETDGTAGRVLRSLGAEQRLTRRATTAALAGFVHLRAQQSHEVGRVPQGGDSTAAAAALAPMLTTAIRQELQPVLRRIERLEDRLGTAETH